MLITVTKTCAVKNTKYIVKGHQENAVMLHNISDGLETFSNKVEHFFENQDPNGAITALLGFGGKKTKTEREIDEAEAAKKLAALKADAARAKAAEAKSITETAEAKAQTATLNAAAAADEAKIPEGFINYYY